jgi:hypothetical protein
MKVRIKIRVRLSDGTYPFLDPVLSANGKVKPLYAIVDGKPEHHPEGSYFLRYARAGKRVWERVGYDAQLALTAKLKREKSLDPKAAGVDLVEDAPAIHFLNGRAAMLSTDRLDLLRVFVQVAESGTISDAADMVGK